MTRRGIPIVLAALVAMSAPAAAQVLILSPQTITFPSSDPDTVPPGPDPVEPAP